MLDPYVIPGVSDGGAHTRFLTAGRYPTETILRAVRDNPILSLEEVHWKLSTLPAYCAGFKDRGTLEEGKAADIVVYDLERLAIDPGGKGARLPGRRVAPRAARDRVQVRARQRRGYDRGRSRDWLCLGEAVARQSGLGDLKVNHEGHEGSFITKDTKEVSIEIEDFPE